MRAGLAESQQHAQISRRGQIQGLPFFDRRTVVVHKPRRAPGNISVADSPSLPVTLT